MPGVVLQANYIESLLEGRFFYSASRLLEVPANILSLLIVVAVFARWSRAAFVALLVSVVMIVVVAAITYRLTLSGSGPYIEPAAWAPGILAAAGQYILRLIHRRRASGEDKPTKTDLSPVSGLVSHPVADVVFVHGLQGDAVETWRTGDGGYWPKWLADDLPDIRVWTMGYEASAFRLGHSMSIRDRALNVSAHMEARGIGTAPIIFVCHSLGGLLVKQIVRLGVEYPSTYHGRLRQQTRGIVFLATPHSGSLVATWADRLLGLISGELLEELRADTSQLRDLNQWYRNVASQLAIKHEAYTEMRGISGLSIVDSSSADPGIPELLPIPLDEDHVSICKPASKDCMLCLRVRAFVLQFAMAAHVDSFSAESHRTRPAPASPSVPEFTVLRRLLTQKLQRPELEVIWFDTFGDAMDDHLPNRSLNQCVIALVEHSNKLGKMDDLLRALAAARPDVIEDLRASRTEKTEND